MAWYSPSPDGGSGGYGRGTHSYGITAAQAYAARRSAPWGVRRGQSLPTHPFQLAQQNWASSQILGGSTNRTGRSSVQRGGTASGWAAAGGAKRSMAAAGGGGMQPAGGGGVGRGGASRAQSFGGVYNFAGTANVTRNRPAPPSDVTRSIGMATKGATLEKGPPPSVAQASPTKPLQPLKPIKPAPDLATPAKGSTVVANNSNMLITAQRPSSPVTQPMVRPGQDTTQSSNLAAYKANLGPVKGYNPGRGF